MRTFIKIVFGELSNRIEKFMPSGLANIPLFASYGSIFSKKFPIDYKHSNDPDPRLNNRTIGTEGVRRRIRVLRVSSPPEIEAQCELLLRRSYGISESKSSEVIRRLMMRINQRSIDWDEKNRSLLGSEVSEIINFDALKEKQKPEHNFAPTHSKGMPVRALQVFLCHSSSDKPSARDLYQRLRAENIDPWLDEEDLLPGQDWNQEILKAVRASDVVIICLSLKSINKAGYVQKEIKYALDIADEQPEGAIFLIPVKLEDCDVPERLRRWQWVNLFEENGFTRLMRALDARAATLGIKTKSGK
jgi:hypothetical protein